MSAELNQIQWPVRFDESNLAPGRPGKRFNSSIIDWQGEYLLAWRDGWSGSEIWLCRLDRLFRPKGESVKLDLMHWPDANYGREDPRLFLHGAALHIAYIGVVGGDQIWHTNQLYARIGDDLKVEKIFSVQYPKRNLWEKNWQFFSHDGQLYAIYSIAPHKILKIDGERAELVYETQTPAPWSGGECRGGTPPMLIRAKQPNPKKIMVRNRARVERKTDWPGSYVVISMYDYHGHPPTIPQTDRLRGVLSLRFQDFDPVRREYQKDEKYQNTLVSEMWMRPEHGRQIWDFLNRHADVDTIVVHCNAAVSRSPAVAMAVADCLGLGRPVIDWYNDCEGKIDPSREVNNAHVYQVCKSEWKPPAADEYHSFFHASTEQNGHRVYHMGHYTFEAKTPFRVKSITPEPMLWANQETRPGDQYSSVIFPCGAILRDDHWIVSCGIHDRWTELHVFYQKHVDEKRTYFTPPEWWSWRPDTSDAGTFSWVVSQDEYRLGKVDLQGQVVIDIGGHSGTFAYAARLRGAAKVFSFEPDEGNLVHLRANAEHLGGVEVSGCAVWSKETALGFRPGGDAHHNNCGLVFPDPTGPVKGIGIDEVILKAASASPNGRVRLLKLDCEGAESVIIPGASRLDLVDHVAGEYHSRFNRGYIRSSLESAGFQVEMTHGENSELGLFFARR